MLIAIVMDPHGHLSQNFTDNATIIRSFRHSPHTDIIETHRLVAKLLVDLLEKRRSITPRYRKVPIMIEGERAVSTDGSMVPINNHLDKVEENHRIFPASFHIGYILHDGDKLGCSVIVVPSDDMYSGYANEIADKIFDFVLARRFHFHYHGIVDYPKVALTRALECEGRPVFLTDSGDNCGAGGDGYSNYVLKQQMVKEDYNQKNF